MPNFSVDVTSNKDEVLKELQDKLAMALETIGLKAEGYAKGYCPVGTPESTGIPGYIGGTLRNSISHTNDGESAYIGTNVEYAPYVELGTRHMHPRHYLKKAAENHSAEYQTTVENIMKS